VRRQSCSFESIRITGSALDRRTTWHASYALSQRIRKRIEEVFAV
jgi:hypothetical protein